MAFKDGMLAISKVLKVVAIVMAAISIAGYAVGGEFVLGIVFGIPIFLMFWTPAWVIKKFVQ